MASVNHHHAVHNHHRTWLPLMLVGAAFLIIVGASVFQSKYGDADWSTKEQVVAPAELKAQYQQQLRQAIVTYRADESSQGHDAFLQALLTMRVPAEYLNPHVELVVAADQIDFSQEGLDAQIDALIQEYTWLQ